jgi:hypothetical protein
MDMGGMDMGSSNATSNSTSDSSSMDMGMGGASACKSEFLLCYARTYYFLPITHSFSSDHLLRSPMIDFPASTPLLHFQGHHPRSARISLNPSLNALELVYGRYLFPLVLMAQQYQSQIRRISNRCIPPRHRHRGFEEVSKGLRPTNRQGCYGQACGGPWRWRVDSDYGRWEGW